MIIFATKICLFFETTRKYKKKVLFFGMETSNFAVSYPSMQIFTFGPNVYDAHTINEHVEISSIEHTWKYMLELLKKI